MKSRSSKLVFPLLAGLLAIAAVVNSPATASAAASAQEILEATGVSGGLVVHLACGDGKLTAALAAGDGYLVHGLDTDTENVSSTRGRIASLDLCGRVTADAFDGKHLPYIDNLVNLVVAESLGDVSMDEIMRVLCPNGVAYIKQGDNWQKTVKPRPDDIDEWTHYLHDASNNAVAQDDRIGPPKHLQWQCGPRWSRHHDHMASVSAIVSAHGRVFSIVDEGSRVSPQLPSDWKLIARDAFNGVLLWKRDIEQWHPRLWPLKSGPANLPRRLVAVGDAVYVTLGIDATVTALNAASGEVLREYDNTAGAEEIISCKGLLLVLVNRTPFDLDVDLADDSEEGRSRDHRTTYSPQMARIWAGVRSRRWANGDRSLLVFDAKTGRPLWGKASRVIPLSLAADGENAYFHDGERVVALDLASGRQRWTSEPVAVWHGLDGRGTQSWFAPSLVACEGKVLVAGGEKTHMSYVGWGSKDIGQDTMTALSAETGKRVWTADHPYAGYNSPEDLFVIDGNVWTGVTAKGGPSGRYTARSLQSGEIEKDFPPTVQTFWFHHRCYRAKATSKYVLCSRTGIEFVDLKTGEWTINHWVRGGCLYGIMPCNGMVYSPPHPCACYPEAKLYGFTALAPERSTNDEGVRTKDEGVRTKVKNRLETGPAYDAVRPSSLQLRTSEDWPTYRGNAARSGASSAEVSSELQRAWQLDLGGRLTQPVVAGGRLFVSQVDRNMIHAVDAESGEKQWSFSVGGPVDSPPTVVDGRVFFGSADGYVYCLRAADGKLIWRFRGAPVDQRLVAFERLESVWPVHGSVLVQDGVVTFVAGRSMFLDGGLRVCRLDAATGRLLGETLLDDRNPETAANLQDRVRGLNMPVALPDILSSDGEHLFMRSQVMDLEGNRMQLGPGNAGPDHLFAAYGFTDDSWFHRTYWLFGNGYSGGVGGFGNAKSKPAGWIMVNNDKTVFGYGRKPAYFRWASVADYQLFAAVRPGEQPAPPRETAAPKKRKGNPAVNYRWARDIPMMVRAMALAGDTLLIAGPPDVLDEEAAFQSFTDAATQQQLLKQAASLKGDSGALFQLVAAETGETRTEFKLDSPPVFDGLVTAGGHVFIATMDGHVIAFGP